MSVYDDSHMSMFKLSAPASGWKTNYIIRKNDNINMDKSVGYNIIYDDIDMASVTGYYVSGYAMNTCDSCSSDYSYGAHMMHVTNAGSISWEAYPSLTNSYRIQHVDLFKFITSTSTTEWYMFGCGFNAFTRTKLNKASVPSGNFLAV